MEFRFDIRPLFTQPIIRVTNHLLPQHFRGDRRMASNASQQVAEIVDTIGEHSAKAQGLSKAVTTSNKLRQSEQKIYLLADVDDGKRGSVIGMLKVGEKALYVFDENGDTKKIDAPCILDFYIHESRQRAGLGKDLFTAMLKEENWNPQKLAIDRPSDKLLGFLRKHYNLDKTIPQMNNFVIYDGFFGGQNNGTNDDFNQVHITSSPNTALFGPYRSSDDRGPNDTTRKLRAEQQASYYSPVIHNTPIGRYAAARPLGSMGEIINGSRQTTGESNSNSHDDQQAANEEVESVRIEFVNLNTEPEPEPEPEIEPEPENEQIDVTDSQNDNTNAIFANIHEQKSENGEEPNFHRFQRTHNKQHTGMKNLSTGVGAAVTPTNKMEFYQENPEDFGIVKINQPACKSTYSQSDNVSVISVGSGDGYTRQGHYDLKFHHNTLW